MVLAAATILPLLSAETLVVRSDLWMPYNGGPPDQPGMVIEVLQAIFAEGSGTVDYAPMPWDAALTAVEAGTADAVIGATASDAKDRFVLPAESIGDLKAGLFVLKDRHWSFERIQSLDGMRIGAINDYTYWPQFDRYLADHPDVVTWFTGENALADAVAALRDGRIDVFPETVVTFLWRAREMGCAASVRVAYVNEGGPIYVAFARSPRGMQLAQRFDAGMRELRQSGALARILEKYGLQDWR